MPTKPLSRKEEHPPFLGGALDASPPPYNFQGVVLRYFPLRADFNALAGFCDNYLNIASEFVHFRPTAPFVLLMVVNYGRMSQQLGNLGWTSQNELLFTVPVDWYRREDDKLVYHSMATVAPFIYVDNDSSQAAGREILGWPKVAGWFSRGVDTWAKHPKNRREVLTLTTRVFDELYEGENLRPRKLLVIEEEPDPSVFEVPPDFKNPFSPLVSVPRTILEWSNLGIEAADMLVRLPFRGYTESVDRDFLSRVRELLRSQKGFSSNFQGNTINVKQMRDANRPKLACYQAITNAKLQITQFHEGGLLGDNAVLRGDLSGGYRIRVNEYESQPIIKTLGLRVESEERHEDGDKTYCLRPILPFWQKMDMRYLHAENVCWRTSKLEWRTDERETDHSKNLEEDQPNFYNTTGPSALQVATGPFRFINTTLRVLPLLADPKRLQELVEERLPAVDGTAFFEPYGRYVFMIITNYGQMYSESNDIGRWADKVVEFAVPVRWRKRKDGELISAGYFCPYMFNNSAIGLTTGREVYGWSVAEAQILSPRNVWLDEGGPVADVTPRLDVKAQVFPAIGVGQESDWRTLIQLDEGYPIGAEDRESWQSVAEGWGRDIKADLQRMHNSAGVKASRFLDLRTMALELLCGAEGFNQFSFKQIRDAEFTDQACYQALLRRRVGITKIHDLREIEDRTHVRLHHYPTHPIAEELGLVVKNSYLSGDSRVDCLQPTRHFYLKVDLKTELPNNICNRTTSDKWEVPSKSERSKGYFEEDGPAGAGGDLVRFLENPSAHFDPNPFRGSVADQNPRRLSYKRKLWREAVPEQQDASSLLQRSDAAVAVNDNELEPQMVIHSVLSQEWENHGETRWLQAESQRALEVTPIDQLPMFFARRDSVGSSAEELFPEEEKVKNVGTGYDYWAPSDAT